LAAVPSRNADVVRANSSAFSARDVEAMLELHLPDAVVVDRRAVGWGEFRGRDALRSYYQGLFDNTDDLQEDLQIVSEQDDVVVASCHVRARLAGGAEGDDVEFDYSLRITLSDGLIATVEIHESTEAALSASA
jgi:ketosteroid isomerase-like protein